MERVGGTGSENVVDLEVSQVYHHPLKQKNGDCACVCACLCMCVCSCVRERVRARGMRLSIFAPGLVSRLVLVSLGICHDNDIQTH